MDVLQRAVNLYIEGGKAVANDLMSLDLGSLTKRLASFDLRTADGPAISLAMLLSVVAALVAVIAYAQLTDGGSPPGPNIFNAAVGTGSGVVRKPGAPPIPPPTEVVSLRIYPIKSCRGLEVDGTRLRKTGLTLDRNWMFVSKSDMKFLTIRSDPTMTLIDTDIVEKDGEQHLQVRIHGKDKKIVIPAFPTQDWLEKNCKLSTVEIWEEDTDGWEYGSDINAMFCDFFKKEVALIYKGPKPRNVNVNGKPELYGQKQDHHFADVMSLQVASEASIKDLNKRLHLSDSKALTIERFRPNIIVRGRDDHPWEEDTWKRVRFVTTIKEQEAIYKIDLDVVARCARCQVPNVNPDTAEKHPKQPWDELMTFRRVDHGGPAKWKPCFGMLCIPKNEGVIKVGATLEVLETTDKHVYNVAPFKDL